MRLLLQSPLVKSSDPEVSKLSTALIEKEVKLVKRSDTEVVRKHIDRGISSLDHHGYPGLRYLNDFEILKSMIQAEKEGFDAVISACWFDPGIEAAKQLLRIPVVGSAESSMHLACMLAFKFAIVTNSPKYIPHMEELVEHYRMSDSVIGRKPVRSLTLSGPEIMHCFKGNYNPIIQNFQEVTKGCIDDGAEVVIIGCGLLSPMLSTSGIQYVDDVPLIDPILVGIKVAEMMVDLHKAGIPTVSRKGLYFVPPYEDIETVLKLISK
jgi:Asp/Glu/hydantoin racemase